jgi:hypothetical protein
MHRDPSLSTADASTLALIDATLQATSAAERLFVLLNRSREAWPYQIAAFWDGHSLAGHSGTGQLDVQGPYAQWLRRWILSLDGGTPGPVRPADVAGDLAQEWAEWWPDHALWLPSGPDPQAPAWVVVRDIPWTAAEAAELHRWFELWLQLDQRSQQADNASTRWNWQRLKGRWRAAPPRQRRLALLMGAIVPALLCWPVHLTVRAPAELVARDPVVLRAAVDGQIRALRVEPNQAVKAGDVLAELDDAGWSSRLQVARQALQTAETEWRQTSQQALNDPRAKVQLAAAQGKYEEKKAEAEFLRQQVQRNQLVAPQDGIVLIQDPGSWPGRTVAAGEAVLKIARPDDQELEAWLAVGDAVDLPEGTPMHLHLGQRPGAPLGARLNSYAYEAEHRPDAGLGYRLRGTLDQPSSARLGSRGTVRLEGPRVPLIYWILRRPLATLRETTGL